MPDLDPQLEAKIRQIVPRLQGWCAVEKALEMAQCLCEIRPRVCVEIGVFGGRSLLPQALACQSLQQGHVFGIDPWSATDSLEDLSHPDDIAYWSQLDHEAIFRDCLQTLLDADPLLPGAPKTKATTKIKQMTKRKKPARISSKSRKKSSSKQCATACV